ncbi:MAG TPA: hypothetical protein VIH93_16225 [Thermoanaerobaculia bacterium]|jgi:hypothetical protein
MRARTLLAAAVLATAASPVLAQHVSLADLSCLAVEHNTVVRATATGEAPGGSARLYFRWKGHGEFYWVGMEPDGGGRFWATPPKPRRTNDNVEQYAALLDESGREIARSEMRSVPVTHDCRADLSPKERGFSENLTIGETAVPQQGKEVFGFLCEGVVTRVNPAGIRRADDACRACVVAWWATNEVIAPLAAVGGVTTVTVIENNPEPSPSLPP